MPSQLLAFSYSNLWRINKATNFYGNVSANFIIIYLAEVSTETSNGALGQRFYICSNKNHFLVMRKIIQDLCPQPAIIYIRPKFLHPLDLGRPISNEPLPHSL